MVVDVLLHPREAMVAGVSAAGPSECAIAARDVALALQRLCDGGLRGIFDGPTSEGIDLDGALVVLDLSAMRDSDALAVLMTCTVAWQQAIPRKESADRGLTTSAPPAIQIRRSPFSFTRPDSGRPARWRPCGRRHSSAPSGPAADSPGGHRARTERAPPTSWARVRHETIAASAQTRSTTWCRPRSAGRPRGGSRGSRGRGDRGGCSLGSPRRRGHARGGSAAPRR
jgi:hypothetical protein